MGRHPARVNGHMVCMRPELTNWPITGMTPSMEATEVLVPQRQHLSTLQQLDKQTSCRMAFNNPLFKLARGCAETPKEDCAWAHFNAEYGQHLPVDLQLCFSIANAPTAWEIAPVK
ncbi:hypothetical protein HYPSUDRAFT_201428 [Hypholoma sublateritium FD-334 SS-4]|uniref:Uncharacterized protein n=1 Tax=Hypholoma sublateritium (strain FD-334 SS-4) TaxID=945553 RepID=A0A0D2PV00_HYPSF|nr:hypothetical protein HYPSUDRAFT_201428 [Hypholoma sublateritium FD-334 SS-4]